MKGQVARAFERHGYDDFWVLFREMADTNRDGRLSKYGKFICNRECLTETTPAMDSLVLIGYNIIFRNYSCALWPTNVVKNTNDTYKSRNMLSLFTVNNPQFCIDIIV